jgi:hypothetical protein
VLYRKNASSPDSNFERASSSRSDVEEEVPDEEEEVCVTATQDATVCPVILNVSIV